MGSGRNVFSPDDTNRTRILQQIRTQGSHSFYSHHRVRMRSFQSLHPAPTAAVRIRLRSRRSTRTAYLHPVHGPESHGGALHPSFVRWGPRDPKPRLSDESDRCGVIDRSSRRHTPPSIPGASSNRDRRQAMFLRPRFLGSKEWFHSKIRDAARFSTPL